MLVVLIHICRVYYTWVTTWGETEEVDIGHIHKESDTVCRYSSLTITVVHIARYT